MAKSKKYSESFLAWRRRQPPSAIMRPSTFEKIMKDAMKRGFSKERAKRIAGAAYWRTAESKYKERKKKK